MRETTSKNLKRLRIQAGFHTQKDLAQALGVDPPYISNLENGKKGIGQEMMTKLCRVLSCTPADFYVPIDDKEKPQMPEHLRFLLNEVEQVFEKKNTLAEKHELMSRVLKALADEKKD